jgi:3-isopropylmalate/(R)-2-methylmalate dehydratase large subunit
MFAAREPSAFSKREFGKDARVWDRTKIVIIPITTFYADSMSNRNVDILREFVKEQELPISTM